MHLSMPFESFPAYLAALLRAQFPDGFQTPGNLSSLVSLALDRVEFSFERIDKKFYHNEGVTQFDHLNADHMASFLWFLSNTVWAEAGHEELAVRLCYLNKSLHGLDLFYTVNMPDVFLLSHPVGTVIGRASFGNYLVIRQGCTVGGSDELIYPTLGNGVIMNAGASIIGDCKIGDDVVLGAGSFIINTDIPRESVVVGRFPDHRLLANHTSTEEEIFSRTHRRQ